LSRHDDLREFLDGKSPAWLAEQLMRAANQQVSTSQGLTMPA
jgi:hypothetical protein